MGDPRKKRKRFEWPRKPFDRERIEADRALKTEYGLKKKQELYGARTIMRKKRASAKKLLALGLERRLKKEKELLDSLKQIGILTGTPSLEDALTLNEKELLERRLQTMVLRKGLANTAKQARQFIVHGHIAVNGKRVDKPGYIVRAGEESKIAYCGKEMQFAAKKLKGGKGARERSKRDELREKFEEAIPEEAIAAEKETEKEEIPAEGRAESVKEGGGE